MNSKHLKLMWSDIPRSSL